MASSSIIAVVGEITLDLVFEMERSPGRNESLGAFSLSYHPGGRDADTAVALYRASHTKPPTATTSGVFINGAVGDDHFGTQLKAKLKTQNIDISGVQIIEGNSGIRTVIVETFTRESRNLGYPGAALKWDARDPEAVKSLTDGLKPHLVIAHLGIPRERIEKVLQTAKKAGVDILFNPSPAASAELATPAAWKSAAEELIGLGVKNVVVTLAEKCAYYAIYDGKRRKVDAVQDVNVKDTTDAEDKFIGMYSVEYLQQKQCGEWDIEKAIKHGCKASARTIERLGALESIPWIDELMHDTMAYYAGSDCSIVLLRTDP